MCVCVAFRPRCTQFCVIHICISLLVYTHFYWIIKTVRTIKKKKHICVCVIVFLCVSNCFDYPHDMGITNDHLVLWFQFPSRPALGAWYPVTSQAPESRSWASAVIMWSWYMNTHMMWVFIWVHNTHSKVR